MGNTTSKTPQDLSALRDQKCEPLALEAFNIIAKFQPNFTAKDRDSVMAAYEPIGKGIMELFLANNLTIGEANYTLKVLMSAFDYTRNLVVQSLQNNFELAQQKLFKAYKNDIGLKAIDEVLKGEEITPSEQPEEEEEEEEVQEDEPSFEPEPIEDEDELPNTDVEDGGFAPGEESTKE